MLCIFQQAFSQTSPVHTPIIVEKDGVAFDGTAFFKFVIISGETTIWSNDGSSLFGEEPVDFVKHVVKQGKFEINLGNSPMKPLYKELLTVFPNTRLKIWINTGDGFYSLTETPFRLENNQFIELPNKKNMKLTKNKIQNSTDAAPLILSEEVIKEKIRKKESGGKHGKSAKYPGEAMKFRYMQRADKNGKIPFGALVAAKNHIDNMPVPKDAGIWTWSWLGPGNIGGRIRAILIHPTSTNTIWIGGVSGGIWKSTNGGSSWSPVDDFMANLAITSIVMDQGNYNVMYAATGEGFYNIDALPGAGIFKSTNGGTTWNQLASTNNTDFKWVNRLAHHPNADSSGYLYAVTRNPHRVWKTTDGGTTWVNILTTTSAAFDVRVHPNYHNRVIVGCRNDVYLSDDYGQSWTEHTTGAANKLPSVPGRCEVTFCPSVSSRIYVSMDRNSGEIWRSTDNGVTWSQQCTGYNYLGTQGWYNNTIWINPQLSNYLVVGGIDLWRSTDGGATLTKISDWHDYHNGGSENSAHCDHHIIIEHPDYDQSTNLKVYFGNDGGIQETNNVWTVSENSGWVNLANTTLGITQFYGGAAAPDGSIIVGGTQDNDKLRYKSSGSWSGTGNWYQATTGDGGFAAVNYTNTSIIYGEYALLKIKKSTNGGDSYSNAINGLEDAEDPTRALFIAPFSLDPNDPANLVAGGSRIWRTTDDAGNWSEIRSDIGGYWSGGTYYYYCCSAIDIDDGNSSRIWVGYQNGNVAMTTNAGTLWTRVDNNGIGLPDRYVTDIAINPINSNQVFVTFSGYNADNVWYTPDAGASWENRSGNAPNDLPALQVNSVRYYPSSSNWIYIGTDLGVFATEDRGTKWSITPRYSGNNEGPCNVEVAELFWQGDEYLIAATHGRGMYRCRPMKTIYVDKNAAPGGNGTAASPYQTVAEAVNAAGHGTTISIESGSYNESTIINLMKRGYIVATNGSVTIY